MIKFVIFCCFALTIFLLIDTVYPIITKPVPITLEQPIEQTPNEVYIDGYYISNTGRSNRGLIKVGRNDLNRHQGKWITGFAYDPIHETNIHTAIYIPIENNLTRFVFERSRDS